MEIYTAKHVTFSYPNAKKPALQDVSFSVMEQDFVLLYGASGSGKTTLLRALKKELRPKGQYTGTLLYKGKPIEALEDRISASQIGYTAQNPDTQTVAAYVRHELAFLLRNLSYSEAEIALRVAQTVSFFGTAELYGRQMDTLSGGEKQLTQLESVFAAQPSVLLLDEPLSQLDPFSEERFLEALRKIKAETSVTILVSSHKLTPFLPLADKVLQLDSGKSSCMQSVDDFLQANPNASLFQQTLQRLGALENDVYPKTVAACRRAVKPYLAPLENRTIDAKTPDTGATCLTCTHAFFRYAKHERDVLEDISLELKRGEIFVVLGANGAGKSTFLQLLSGQYTPYSGKVKRKKGTKVAYVPQNPQAVFAYDSVLEILEAAYAPPTAKTIYRHLQTETPAESIPMHAPVQKMAERLGLCDVLYRNPFDLSGGEQQRVALACALLENPDVFLLDEITKGLETAQKAEIKTLLETVKAEGKAILLVTHDLDFAAEIADKVALLFDGKLLGTAPARPFFTGNRSYTSTVSKIFGALPVKSRPITLREVSHEN